MHFATSGAFSKKIARDLGQTCSVLIKVVVFDTALTNIVREPVQTWRAVKLNGNKIM